MIGRLGGWETVIILIVIAIAVIWFAKRRKKEGKDVEQSFEEIGESLNKAGKTVGKGVKGFIDGVSKTKEDTGIKELEETAKEIKEEIKSN